MKTIHIIDRTATVANVLSMMRENIILQKYSEGQKLVEQALSAEYNASRGSVRAALSALEHEGLITTLPNGRKLVAGISEQFINDLYSTRRMIECEAVRLIIAAEKIDYSGLAEAVSTFSDLEESSDEVMMESRVAQNMQFHRIILEMSHNRPLLQCWNTLEPLFTVFAQFNSKILGAKIHKELYINPHEKILEMLIRKDPALIDYMAYHIKVAAKEETLVGLQSLWRTQKEASQNV